MLIRDDVVDKKEAPRKRYSYPFVSLSPSEWATGEAIPDYQLVWQRRHPWFMWYATAYPEADAAVDLRPRKRTDRGAL